MDGYVSFADVQGLGVPEGEADEDLETDDAVKRRRAGWLRWLSLGSQKGRERSTEGVPSR